jgi:hypothetical protein
MEPLQIGNILIAQERVAQLDRSRVVTSVLRENFRNGEVTVVRVCPSPYILSLLALGMIVVGLLTARGLVDWLSYGGTVYDVSIMMILMLPAGVWLLYQAWRRATMLLIATHKGTVRMEFTGPRTQEAVAALQRAAQERGYALRRGSGVWL